MKKTGASRRSFLIRSVSGVSSAWLASSWPGILAAQEHAHRVAKSGLPAKFDFFSPEEAVEVEAMTAQIIPSDDTPGAREARCVYFIDRALATFDRDKQSAYTQGLKDLQTKAGERFPVAIRFSGLTSAQQIELLAAIDKTEFFELVRRHTIVGFLANPEHGGNYNEIGWKLMGFEDKFVFEPPFGFYDRDYKQGS
jgi:gluconate 2-dehydrogenase gamma chain